MGRLVNDPMHNVVARRTTTGPSRDPACSRVHRNGEQLGRVDRARGRRHHGGAVGVACRLHGPHRSHRGHRVGGHPVARPRRGGTDDPDAAVEAEQRGAHRRSPRLAACCSRSRRLRRQYFGVRFHRRRAGPAGLLPAAVPRARVRRRRVRRGVIVALNAGFTFTGVLLSGALDGALAGAGDGRAAEAGRASLSSSSASGSAGVGRIALALAGHRARRGDELRRPACSRRRS